MIIRVLNNINYSRLTLTEFRVWSYTDRLHMYKSEKISFYTKLKDSPNENTLKRSGLVPFSI